MQYLALALFLTGGGLLVLRNGSAPERMVLLIMVAGTLLDFAYHGLIGSRYFGSVNLGHMVLDSGLFGGFLVVGLRANRVWPLWICAMQLQPLAAHLSMLLHLPAQRIAYWLMMTAPANLQLLPLALGTIAHFKRRRRVGPYRDWRLT